MGWVMNRSGRKDDRVLGDARRIAVILQNLTENAVKYCSAGGTVKLSARAEAETGQGADIQ